MTKWTLPPTVYVLLQRFVHGGHDGLRAELLREYAPFGGSPVLELGCGTGDFAEFFEPGTYTGVDIDGARIEAARRAHPTSEFVCADVRSLDAGFFDRFRFIFCHAWLHHVDDVTCREIFATIARGARTTPRVLAVYEPVLANPIRNPVGWMLGKLDRGDFVRPADRLRQLCEPYVERMEVHPGPWRWPVPGASMRLIFDAERAATAGAR